MMLMIYPAAAMVALIFVLGLLNFKVRFKAARNGTLKFGYFKLLDVNAYSPPEFVVRMGRHYDHQFELPMLYLITCVACVALKISTPAALLAGWGFVLSRLVHSFIHLTSNNVLRRASAFFLGWFFVIVLWGVILYET